MKSLGIYIHIPFCIRKCLYCDFLSFPKERTQQALYFDVLEKEIVLASEDCGEYVVDSIFFGGGTPTSVDPGNIVRIMRIIRDNYTLSREAEITIECNPGTAGYDALKTYRDAGINRLSIGLQSANDDELKRLGRIHNISMFRECYEYARKAGFENINVDLMSALPGQSMEDWENNLNYVCGLKPKPEHISAYSLIIEEGTPFYDMYGGDENDENSWNTRNRHDTAKDNKLPLPDEDTERSMYHRTQEILSEQGYHRYEISNYSTRERECRHNLRYWQGGDYLGVGLGAASLIKGKRFHNTSDFEKYTNLLRDVDVNGGSNAKNDGLTERLPDDIREDVEALDERAKMEEYMFLGLRLTAGVSAAEFKNRFGKEIGEIYGDVIENLREKSLLEWDGDMIRLTAAGLDVSNYCMAEFLF